MFAPLLKIVTFAVLTSGVLVAGDLAPSAESTGLGGLRPAFNLDEVSGRLVVSQSPAGADWSLILIRLVESEPGSEIHIGDPDDGTPSGLFNEAAVLSLGGNQVPEKGGLAAAREASPISAGDYLEFCAWPREGFAVIELASLDGTIYGRFKFERLTWCLDPMITPLTPPPDRTGEWVLDASNCPSLVDVRGRGLPVRVLRLDVDEDASTDDDANVEDGAIRLPVDRDGCARVTITLSIAFPPGHHDCMHDLPVVVPRVVTSPPLPPTTEGQDAWESPEPSGSASPSPPPG